MFRRLRHKMFDFPLALLGAAKWRPECLKEHKEHRQFYDPLSQASAGHDVAGAASCSAQSWPAHAALLKLGIDIDD